MHECFLNHLRMGTSRMKEDKETDEEDKPARVKMERSKRQSLLWPGASRWRINYHCSWGYLSTTCSIATEVARGKLPFAIDHSQQRNMAFETVDRINWPLLHTLHRAVPPISTCTGQMEATNHKTCGAAGTRTRDVPKARQPQCLCGHSEYNPWVKWVRKVSIIIVRFWQGNLQPFRSCRFAKK